MMLMFALLCTYSLNNFISGMCCIYITIIVPSLLVDLTKKLYTNLYTLFWGLNKSVNW